MTDSAGGFFCGGLEMNKISFIKDIGQVLKKHKVSISHMKNEFIMCDKTGIVKTTFDLRFLGEMLESWETGVNNGNN